jgi:hypothetical protein
MKLADLRKLSIQRQSRIRFRMRNGMECVITEHGVATVPGLHRAPDFNLEDELALAEGFVLEPANPVKKGPAPAARSLERKEIAALFTASAPGGTPEHEDE